jgi:hypothetical protein
MKRRNISKSERAREVRLRRHARRHGLALVKSSSRKPGAIDFGGFMIVEPTRGVVLAGGSPHRFSLSLEDVEACLIL